MTTYLDGVAVAAGGRSYKDPVRAATTAALPASTYAGGALAADANGALPAQDGVALAVGDRLLIKNQAAAAQNGLYTVTSLGSGGSRWALARAADADASDEFVPGELVVVQEGATLADTIFELVTNAPIVLDVTALTFAAVSASAATPLAGEVTGTLGATALTGPVAATVPFSNGLTIATAKKVAGVSELLLDTAAGQYVAVQIGGGEKARFTSTGGLAIATTNDPGAGVVLVGSDAAGTFGLFYRWTNATNYPLASLTGSTVVLGNPSFPAQIRSSGDMYIVRAGVVVVGLLANGTVQAGNSDGTTTSLTDATFRATDVGATADLAAPGTIVRGGIGRGAGAASSVKVQGSIAGGAGAGAQTLADLAKFVDSAGAGDTAMLVRVNRAGVFTLDRVTIGAADSGGAGFRCLRVAN